MPYMYPDTEKQNIEPRTRLTCSDCQCRQAQEKSEVDVVTKTEPVNEQCLVCNDTGCELEQYDDVGMYYDCSECKLKCKDPGKPFKIYNIGKQYDIDAENGRE